jgi:hypothetical protein
MGTNRAEQQHQYAINTLQRQKHRKTYFISASYN